MKARFLWKRLPSTLKTSAIENKSELYHVWSLIQLFIERKYSAAFTLIQQQRAANFQWSTLETRNLVEQLVDVSKKRLLDLISLAYLSINVQEMASLFGVSDTDAINLGLSENWSLDDTKTFLNPLKKRKH